jgi:hypothetical protein
MLLNILSDCLEVHALRHSRRPQRRCLRYRRS